MKTTVICGILGSGKTTFLNNVLKHEKGKTVVLVNDFGSVGIDGEIFSVGGIETIELKSGCVCCTLRFDLITTITKVREQFCPDHLFIEPSGVASPSAITNVLDMLNIQPVTVVGIVDATDFLEAYKNDKYGWFFKSQITQSDIILSNKADLVDEQKINETIRVIEMLNPLAVVTATVNAMLNADILSHGKRAPRKQDNHGHSLDFETMTVLFDRPKNLTALKTFFEKMASGKYGNIMRAKALIQTDSGPYRFDLASKQVNAVVFSKKVTNSRLVIIGTNLNEESIRKDTGVGSPI